jgi:hypothetical protein
MKKFDLNIEKILENWEGSSLTQDFTGKWFFVRL